MGALNVGREVMGTMANILILAYAGEAIPLLLLVKGYAMDWMMIVNHADNKKGIKHMLVQEP